jgi:hypothetical protein
MNSDERKKIDSVIVLEVLGRPPEYLIETLNNIIKSISNEKGVAVKRTDIKEPVEMANQKGFYSSFAELEVETDDINYLAVLIFKYMPAHIDVLSPQNLSLSNSGWNVILNEIIRTMHGYEEIVRISQTEKIILENQLKTILGKEKLIVTENKPEIKEKKKEAKAKKPKKEKVKEEE